MWKITRDLRHEPATAVFGTSQPSAVGQQSPDFDESKAKYEFRLSDGQGYVYFYGVSDDNTSQEPLSFGMSEAGCEKIEYKQENNTWKRVF